MSDATLARIGDRHGRSTAQVALRWLVQQEGVVAIPKATSRDHLAANLAVFDVGLSREEMDRIGEVRGGSRRRRWNRLPGLQCRFPV